MDRRFLTASILASAVGLTGLASSPASAAMNSSMQQKLNMMMKEHPGASKKVLEHNMTRMAKYKLQACYGINAIGKNDCAAGAHSCAGQATQARDPASFVLLPAGDCGKIAGGSLKPGKV